MTTRWDPAAYERFQAERDRPALDLMLRLPADLDPRQVWDLGCGTGEHAAMFARRWPDARVHGLDASAEMLERARARPEPVEWVEADLGAWSAPEPAGLIFSNAAVQWLADHERLIPHLAAQLAPGGVLALQAPLSHDAPQHVLLRETAADGPWAAAMAGLEGVRPLGSPQDYYGWLAPLCEPVEIWTTTYLHVLTGEDAVVDWMLGTGLRPYLSRLSSDAERSALLAAYRARLARAFPRRAEGTTLLPFPRLFVLARRR